MKKFLGLFLSVCLISTITTVTYASAISQDDNAINSKSVSQFDKILTATVLNDELVLYSYEAGGTTYYEPIIYETDAQIGDIINIYYDGSIMESYPGQVNSDYYENTGEKDESLVITKATLDDYSDNGYTFTTEDGETLTFQSILEHSFFNNEPSSAIVGNIVNLCYINGTNYTACISEVEQSFNAVVVSNDIVLKDGQPISYKTENLVGSIINIFYDGTLMETYPYQVNSDGYEETGQLDDSLNIVKGTVLSVNDGLVYSIQIENTNVVLLIQNTFTTLNVGNNVMVSYYDKSTENDIPYGYFTLLDDIETSPSQYYFDVNADGKNNIMDLLMLKKFLLDLDNQLDIDIEIGDVSTSSYDVNLDGKVNTPDLLTLKKYLLGLF